VRDQVSHPYKTTGRILVLYIVTAGNTLEKVWIFRQYLGCVQNFKGYNVHTPMILGFLDKGNVIYSTPYAMILAPRFGRETFVCDNGASIRLALTILSRIVTIYISGALTIGNSVCMGLVLRDSYRTNHTHTAMCRTSRNNGAVRLWRPYQPAIYTAQTEFKRTMAIYGFRSL
jgi:hypothetical protein